MKFGLFLTMKININQPQKPYHMDPNQGVLHLYSKFGDPGLNEPQVIVSIQG